MKRFLAFKGWDEARASGCDEGGAGGWDDFVDNFETINEAKEILIQTPDWDWAQIVDLELGKVVLRATISIDWQKVY